MSGRLEEIPRAECLRLIRDAPVGRVAVIVGEVPIVVPVNFALDGEDIVFRTATGTKLLAAVSQSTLSFEADAVDEIDHSGWSVLVTGPAMEIQRPERLANFESWVDGRDRYVRIRADIVTGRRVPSRSEQASDVYWEWGEF